METKSKEEQFADIMAMMLETYKAKNHDYGDCFSVLFCELGMPYAYGHLKEKLYRVKSLMQDAAKVKDERMEDSLLDLANYAILTLLELNASKDGRINNQ